ncbi:major facilitator superfamily domain-containing protein 6-like [Uloborus diversus]|uniref:major facilitator superfamily domain-containing protein 6-like n=1 Tax=Uloborus diversus TaxID=327109 RepID=UPI00240A928A|nr:major facilitator superfamily domain-containing protein 6-like [Uloborus diversus]
MDRFKEDFFRKELAPIKILMFLIYGGQATLYPYFTVHLRSLGVSVNHTAIIFAVQPIIALFVAPMIGMVADKIGNFKAIFCFFLCFSAVTSNFLLFVPNVPELERSMKFQLQCGSDVENQFSFLKNDSCVVKNSFKHSYLNLSLQPDCQTSCVGDDTDDIPTFILNKDGTDCCKQTFNDIHDKCLPIYNSTFDLYLQMHNLSEANKTLVAIPNELYFFSYSNTTYDSMECSCHKDSCDSMCTFISQDPVRECVEVKNEEFGATFFTYLGIRLVVTLGMGLVNGLFDAASMTIIQEHKADVGFQRIWQTVGMCIFAPISGYFVDTLHNFQPCFFMYGALYVTAALISLKLDLSMKIPSDNPLKNLAKLLKNPEVLLLLFQIAALGICWGFLENYLFWYLEEELESNYVVLGLTVTVGNGSGILMALVSTWFTRKLGYVNVIIVAFAAYVVRFIGYATATNAYVCLIFEMMENFTVTLLTVGVTLYCTELAPPEMITTIMTLWNGLHIISGRAFGSLLGGFLANTFGFRQTFYFFAYGSAVLGACYALIYICWLRKWRHDRRKPSIENEKKEHVTDDDMEKEAIRSFSIASSSMNCSFDSPVVVYFIPSDEEEVLRRRAASLTHIPTNNSFRSSNPVPRHAVSFSHGHTRMDYDQVLTNLIMNTLEDIDKSDIEEIIKLLLIVLTKAGALSPAQ